MPAIRVHKKRLAVIGNRKTKMIGNSLMHVQPCRPAKGSREIDPLLPVIDPFNIRCCCSQHLLPFITPRFLQDPAACTGLITIL